MNKQNYSIKNLKENMAKAIAKDAPVSWKTSVEMTKFLKGKTTKQAKAYLEKVLEKKLAIPFTRFNGDVGHRRGNGIAAGRYPQKLSKVVIALLNNAEANASMKGLGENLKIVHFVANKAAVPMHYGRHARREMKRTHIELIVEEVEEKKKSTKKSTPKKVETKVEKTEVSEKPAKPKVEPKKEIKPVETKKVEVQPIKKAEVKLESKLEEKKVVESKPLEETTKTEDKK